jgi:hypothetical protein
MQLLWFSLLCRAPSSSKFKRDKPLEKQRGKKKNPGGPSMKLERIRISTRNLPEFSLSYLKRELLSFS